MSSVLFPFMYLVNVHRFVLVGSSAYLLKPCTHLSTSMILLKTHSIILIQTILTRNCYNNGRLHMNPLLIFSNTSMTCSFKLRGATWNLLIFGTSSITALRNLPIPRENLRSSLAQHSSLMELLNLMWQHELSQLNIFLPLIQQLNHYPVMLRIILTHLFILHTLWASLHSIFSQIWLWALRVLICILFYDLRFFTQVFLQMIFSCFHLF